MYRKDAIVDFKNVEVITYTWGGIFRTLVILKNVSIAH